MSSVLLAATYVVLLWGPGLLVAGALRVPLRVALAAAPAVTYGLVGVSTPVLAELGVGWALWSSALVLAAALLAAFGVRLVAARRGATDEAAGRSPDGAPWWLAGFGVAAAAVLALLVLRAGVGRLDAINQYWDAVWHANYTRWIAESGQASPLRAGQFWNGDDGGALYYPSAMHAHGALLMDLLGEPAVRVVNVGLLVLCALLAPIGAAALAWAARSGDGLAAAFAALAAVLFSTMPFDQVWRPAYPFGLCLALSGTAVALLVSPRLASWSRLPLAALACAGAVSVQPAAAVCVGLPVLCWLVGRALLRRSGLTVGALVMVGVLAGIALAPQLLAAARVGGAVAGKTYPTPFSVLNAAGQVLSFRIGFPEQPGQWVLTGLVVSGAVVVLISRRGGWLVAAFAVFGVLAVHTTAGLWDPLRWLSGAFWNDRWRLAATTAFVGAALIGIGLAAVTRFAATRVAATRAATPATAAPATAPAAATPGAARDGVPVRWQAAIAVLIAIGVLAATSGGYHRRNADHLRIGYTPGVVGPDHLAAMRELSALVGSGERVLNDPVDGSGWMYAVTGVRPIFVHYDVGAPGPRERLLLERFDELDTDTEVRRAVTELGVRYVYMGDRTIYPWVVVPPGFDDVERAHSLTPVLHTSTATVYRIDLG